MFRLVLPMGLFLLPVASSAALLVTIDPGQIAYRDPDGVSVFSVRGTLDCTALGGSVQVSSARMAAFTASGSGASFATSSASVSASLVNGLKQSRYAGELFTVRVPANKPLGTYTGTVFLSLRIGRNTYTTQAADIAFTVANPPPAVPEPGALAALGLGVGVFIRRRRR